MSSKPPFRPGTMLHEAIMGALRARGMTLKGWCRENDVTQMRARGVTCGLSAGPQSRELLEQLIDDADRETVTFLYRRSLDAETRRVA